MLQHKTRAFIADLWFVLAMLTPVFTPILLIGFAPTWPLAKLARAMLAGPLSAWFLSFGYPVDFTMLCALPTLFVASHAFVLRVMACGGGCEEPVRASPSGWRFWGALLVLLATHLVATLAALCVHAWQLPQSSTLGLWGGTLILYVVVTSIWCLSRRSRAYAFEMILGLILTEHLAWPMLGHLFTS